MVFIRVQKLVRDDKGNIVSGSASIVTSVYQKGAKYHSKQKVLERLGKILYLADDKKSGIFLSKTRGLVEYNVISGKFSEVDPDDDRLQTYPEFTEPERILEFGDTYLFLTFLKNNGILAFLREVFSTDSIYERVLCHIVHEILRNGGNISYSDFMLTSYLPFLFRNIQQESLDSDTEYYTELGKESVRKLFFQKYREWIQTKNDKSGYTGYLDSAPMPLWVELTPFSRKYPKSTRLVQVSDTATGNPLWFTVLPEESVSESANSRIFAKMNPYPEIEISNIILDEGYLTKDLTDAWNRGEMQNIIAKLPETDKFSFYSLYRKNKPYFRDDTYYINPNDTWYFAKQETVELFGNTYFAYVYFDRASAYESYLELIQFNPEIYEEMTPEEQVWEQDKGGFFILISPLDKPQEEILEMYCTWISPSTLFKTAYDDLPKHDWNSATVHGRILDEIITGICFREFFRAVTEIDYPVSEVLGIVSSLFCTKGKDEFLTVDSPTMQTAEIYHSMGIRIPAHLDLKKFRKEIYCR